MIRTRSPVLALLLRGAYAEGAATFETLSAPSAEDQRWAGLCLFNLGRPLEARTLLLRAWGRGCREAAIELCTVYRQLGEPQQGKTVLAALDIPTLSLFDQALAQREWGVSLFAAGEIQPAAAALERAWTAAVQTTEETALLPGIGLTLGYVCLAQGAEQKALFFLRQALEHAHGLRRLQLLTVLGACHTAVGKFDLAQEQLQMAAQEAAEQGRELPTLAYHQASLARYQGHPRRALELFQTAAEWSRQAEEADTECHAELGRCAVLTELGDAVGAALALARAEAIPALPRVAALVLMRRGALAARQAQAEAPGMLQAAVEQFRHLGLHREQGWASLHLAEAGLRLQQHELVQPALLEAASARAALRSSPVIALELRGLPELFATLQRAPQFDFLADWAAFHGVRPLHLEITAFGGPGLRVDGHPVRPNASLAKTTEVLVYLLMHPQVPLERVLADVFPEKPATAARAYFHLIRTELARVIPGLAVHFHRLTQTYSVDLGGLTLKCDVLDLQRHLYGGGLQGVRQALALYPGPFLPEAETEWAMEARSKMEWLVVRVGLETLEDYYRRGEDSLCLELAERLLEVAPLNEGINALLIQATERLKGAVAARHALERAQRRFQNEVGEIPVSLAGFSRLKA